jgi:hypothetical protein
MTDAFALLGVPRRPWLDLDDLKTRYLHQSSDTHPDRVHGASESEKSSANERYTALNSSYVKLKDTRERLLHILELETGAPPSDIQRIPPGTMDLFVEVGQTCRDCDAFLARRASSDSPMFRLQTMREGFGWNDRLSALKHRIDSRRAELESELASFNPVWDAAPTDDILARRSSLPLERLEQIYRVMSYISRWTSQIQERVVQLSI